MAKRKSPAGAAKKSTTRAEKLAEKLGYAAGAIASKVTRRRPAAPAKPRRKARSGGTVDAPGKKHRKPVPPGPPPAAERARNARMRAVNHISKQIPSRARQG